MACTVDEEFAAVRGVDSLAELWESRQGFLSRRPDRAIVAEPTMLDVVVAHKGSLRWRCHARGRAAHSSQPSLGDNAIYRMTRVIRTLEVYAHEIVPKLSHHPRLGAATLSVGMIQGGLSVNTVPDRCTIEVDRRLLPGDDHQQAFAHVAEYLRSHLPRGDWEQIEFDPPFLTSGALDDSINLPWGNQVGEIASQFGDYGKIIGVNYGTDAPPLAREGIPTIVFGPGSIAQAHTADEWISIDQLELATKILERIIANPVPHASYSS
jgi:acetylornithine deacetylase